MIHQVACFMCYYVLSFQSMQSCYGHCLRTSSSHRSDCGFYWQNVLKTRGLLLFWVFGKCWLLCSIIYLIVRLHFPAGWNLWRRPACLESALLLSRYMLYHSSLTDTSSPSAPLQQPCFYGNI